MVLDMLMEMEEGVRYDWFVLAKNGAFKATAKTEEEIAHICRIKQLKNARGVARVPSTEKLFR